MSHKIALCLVCGFSEAEVEHMHYFPKKLERCSVWQENMCIKISGESIRNYRICSRHFTPDCYSGSTLRRGAVPTLLAAHGETSAGAIPVKQNYQSSNNL